VVGNGIRTIGHLFHLLYNFHDIVRIRAADSENWIQLCGNVALALAKKIQVALQDATDSSFQRSWKHRSHAKRHAWGACYALSSLLSTSCARMKENVQGIAAALHQLIRCVELAHIINEKIATSAVITLEGTQKLTWRASGLLGNCLAASLIQATAKTKMSQIFKDGIRSMTCNMVEWANHQDILTCLGHQDISLTNINFLYSLMVEEKKDYGCYERIGVALQFTDFHNDISLIQKFQSRAVLQERQQQKPTYHGVDSFQELLSQDEDEDEL